VTAQDASWPQAVGKAGSKHHLLVDAQAIPVNVILTKANRHDVSQLLPLADGVHPIEESAGGH
jgi:hypothetical protein